MIAWCLTFSISMLLNKGAKDILDVPSVLSARCFLSLCFFLVFPKKTYLFQHLWLQTARGLCIAVAMTSSYTVYRYLPGHVASMIGASGPMFTLGLSWVVLKESISWRCWGWMILGGFGVGILSFFSLSTGGEVYFPYLMLSLFGNLCAAGAILLGRALAEKKAGKSTTLLYGSLIPFLVFTAFNLLIYKNYTLPTGGQWRLLGIVSGFGAISQWCMFSALQQAPASYVTSFEYLRVCIFILLNALVFMEIPPLSFYVGATCIVFSTLQLTGKAQQNNEKKKISLKG